MTGPLATPTDRRERPETRERILAAAAEVFASRGFRGSAVDDIVVRSGTSKGSFYNFFPSKEAIFLALLERVGATLLKGVMGLRPDGSILKENPWTLSQEVPVIIEVVEATGL